MPAPTLATMQKLISLLLGLALTAIAAARPGF
jgi:hypothetical protein